MLSFGWGGYVVAPAVTKALLEKDDLARERTYIAPGAEVSVIMKSVKAHTQLSKRLKS